MKRIISFVLIIALVAACPFAHAEALHGECGDNLTWELSDGTLTVSGTGDMYDYDQAPWGDGVEVARIGQGVASLGARAFAGCEKLTGVLLPTTLLSVGDSAFEGCKALRRLYLPYRAGTLGKDSLKGCETDLWILDPSVTPEMLEATGRQDDMPPEVFSRSALAKAGKGSPSLGRIPDLSEDVSYGKCADYVSFSFDKTTDTLTIYGTGVTDDSVGTTDPLRGYIACTAHVSVEPGVTGIGASQFKNGAFIRDISLPDGLEAVGASAFNNCMALDGVELPDSVTELGRDAFYGCCGLTSVRLPAGLTSIPAFTFAGCGFTDLPALPEGLTAIETSAFYGCERLKSAVLPEGITTVGAGAFARCYALESVKLPASLKTLGDDAFQLCYSMTEVGFSEGLDTIGKHAFSGCNALKSAVIPESVRRIDRLAFSGCSEMTDITVKNPYCFIYVDKYVDGTLGEKDVTVVHALSRSTAAEYAGKYGYRFDPTGTLSDKPQFSDVASGAFYTVPVLWATLNGVTDGVSETKFAPNAVCTRAHVVTFLWRAAGSPEPSGTEHPFTDVNETSFYYKAMLWAVENGVTNGVSETEFAPNDPCTRAQVVTFLWRSAGAVKTPHGSQYRPVDSFRDVNMMGFYYYALMWATDHAITSGTARDAFSPNDPCTRGQVVTFLFRLSEQYLEV